MKKLPLLLLFLTTTLSFAQIKIAEEKTILIGEIAPMGNLHIKCEKEDQYYKFTYSDTKYSAIDVYKSFAFNDENNAFNNLYETMLEGLSNPPSEDIKLELPDSFIWLKFQKAFGIGNVMILHDVHKNGEVVGSTIWLTKRKLKTLFGK